MSRTILTDAQVEYIRTARLTDAYLARKFGRALSAVRAARVGLSHKDHPTPPDIGPRRGGGRKSRPEAIIENRLRGAT